MNAQLPAPVQAFFDAVEARDTSAFAATFGAQGFIDDWGRQFVGPDAIRSWSDREFIGVNVTLAITDVHTTGDETVVTANVGGDGFNGPSHFTFVVADDLVHSMTITA